MRMIKNCLMWTFCFLSVTGNAQKKQIKPLSVGDATPDFIFKNVWNYKTKTAKLSDFKKKLVILDFWSTGCSACIAAFPKMSSLQKRFGNDIEILLVNSLSPKWETPERIKKTLIQYKNRTGDSLKLALPMYDTLLNSYFPHLTVPHEVWIDQNRRVIGITTPQFVTENNIQALLNGKKLQFPVKNDFYQYDPEVPILVNSNGGDDKDFVYRSLFTKYNSALETKMGRRANDENELTRYFVYNYPLRAFVNSAYTELLNGIAKNRIIYEVKNIERYTNLEDTINKYCYELDFSNGVKGRDLNSEIAPFLKKDLFAAFNISLIKKKRRMNCFVVIKVDSGKLKTKYEHNDYELSDYSPKKFFHDCSADDVFRVIEYHCDKPIINETGMTDQKIDIDFPDNFDLSNQQAVIVFLKSIGFDIKEEERELDVVVITDK